MEKTFVEFVTKIQVNEEVHLGFGNAEIVVSRSRTIKKVRVVETNTMEMGTRITEEGLKLIEVFDNLKFKVVESGLVGENESGSLKVEMHYRELQVVGLVLA